MVNTKDQDEYIKCLAEFNLKSMDPKNIVDHLEVTGDDDFQYPVGKNQAHVYFNKNWEPIKNKWAGYLTKKLAHFGCLSTQRAESAHHAHKVGMSKRMDLITAFEHMDTYWDTTNGKFELLSRRERQKTDTLLINNMLLKNIMKRVPRAALIAAHSACLAVSSETLDEGELGGKESCTCFARLNSKLPCVHTVLDLDGKNFQQSDIDERWHLNELDNHFSTSFDRVEINGSEVIIDRPFWYSLLSTLELKFREFEGNSEKND